MEELVESDLDSDFSDLADDYEDFGGGGGRLFQKYPLFEVI